MSFAQFADLIQESANGTRRASETSFEVENFYYQSIFCFTSFDKFVFKPPHKSGKDKSMKSILNRCSAIEIYGKNVNNPILVGVRKRSILHPFTPPVSILDLNSRKILTIDDTVKGLKCFWDKSEVQILSSTGLIGRIRNTTSHGVKTFEILDAYSQIAFHITPNLAPHRGLQFLILGSERSLLTAAVFEEEDHYSLEIFKPISPNLKALLVSFSIFIIFSNCRSQFDL